MFGSGSVVLLLPLQIAEATENIDSLASSPTVPRQPQGLQQCVPGELEVTSISKKVSILAQTPGHNVMISARLGVPYWRQQHQGDRKPLLHYAPLMRPHRQLKT